MRRFAWACVVVGLLVAVGSPFVADHLTAQREAEALGVNSARALDEPYRLDRMFSQGARPTAVFVSPWSAVIAGAALAGFGVLVLAIRRPTAPVDHQRGGAA